MSVLHPRCHLRNLRCEHGMSRPADEFQDPQSVSGIPGNYCLLETRYRAVIESPARRLAANVTAVTRAPMMSISFPCVRLQAVVAGFAESVPHSEEMTPYAQSFQHRQSRLDRIRRTLADTGRHGRQPRGVEPRFYPQSGRGGRTSA